MKLKALAKEMRRRGYLSAEGETIFVKVVRQAMNKTLAACNEELRRVGRLGSLAEVKIDEVELEL